LIILLIVWLLGQPLFWAAMGVAVGPVLFLRGFRSVQRKRLILDTPRSSVRAAALGPVEVWGKAVGPYTLVAPLSRQQCLYYRVVVESNPRGDLSQKMREMCAPLYLDDGTGKLMIYPVGADLQIPASSRRSEYGKLALALYGHSVGNPEFCQEYCILPGDEIFVLGTLQENPWAKANPAAELSELSRVGPGFVSQAEADVLQHGAFAGLDPALPAAIALASADEFDFHAPVLLMKNGGPFVISTASQRDIASKLHWQSILYIWGGPAAALWGLWEIFAKAKAAGLLPGNF
jgi:hypothetical protein